MTPAEDSTPKTGFSSPKFEESGGVTFTHFSHNLRPLPKLDIVAARFNMGGTADGAAAGDDE
jgi:hypothetical protein|eukprot:7390907-Prymnesium_polylepis.3